MPHTSCLIASSGCQQQELHHAGRTRLAAASTACQTALSSSSLRIRCRRRSPCSCGDIPRLIGELKSSDRASCQLMIRRKVANALSAITRPTLIGDLVEQPGDFAAANVANLTCAEFREILVVQGGAHVGRWFERNFMPSRARNSSATVCNVFSAARLACVDAARGSPPLVTDL